VRFLGAEDWYAAGSFWVSVLVGVAGIVIGAVGAVAALRGQKQPKRRLVYGLPEVTPMLAAPDGVRADLELRHRGEVLKEPFLASVLLACQGNTDIASGDFDQQEPIQLDLGVDIIAILGTATRPEGLRAPTVRVDGTALMVGPSFFARQQTLLLTVLVDGEPALTMESSVVAAIPERLEDVARREQRFQDMVDIAVAAVPFPIGVSRLLLQSFVRAAERLGK